MRPRSSSLSFLACISLCLTGCGHGKHGSAEHGPAEHGSAEHGSAEHGSAEHGPGQEGHGSELGLTLDDGEKWQVDEHTRASAARLAALAGGAEPFRSAQDAHALAESLDRELDLLVQKCTMTGPAHDQLHVFLVAFIPRVAELKEKTEIEDLRRIRAEIGSLLEAYAAHFE